MGRYQTSGFDRQFDNEALGGYGGLSFLRGRDLYRARISYSALLVDAGRYRNISALGGEWQRQLDELNTVSLFGQYAALAWGWALAWFLALDAAKLASYRLLGLPRG